MTASTDMTFDRAMQFLHKEGGSIEFNCRRVTITVGNDIVMFDPSDTDINLWDNFFKPSFLAIERHRETLRLCQPDASLQSRRDPSLAQAEAAV